MAAGSGRRALSRQRLGETSVPTLSEIMRPATLFWAAIYIGLIVLVNWLFIVVQSVDMGGGEMCPPVA